MNNFSTKARAYILSAIVAAILILFWDLISIENVDWPSLVFLSSLASLALLFKVEGVTERSHYNISFLIFGISFIVLGAPATLGVIVIANLVEWIRHRYPWYIQCFNIANYVIALAIGGWLFSLFGATSNLSTVINGVAVMTAMGIFTLVNHLMIGLVIWLARGQSFRESGVFETLPLMIDFTMLILGSTIGWLWLEHPGAIPLILFPLYLIYSTLRMPALVRKTEIDAKTGIYNARYFHNFLADELDRAARFTRPLSVIMADMDLLRNINNAYGHLAGDVVLKGVAGILQKGVREFDTVARFGGEEFAILLPETDIEVAFEVAERLRRAIESSSFSVSTSVEPLNVTMSFGVACLDHQHDDCESLIHRADLALYRAKEQGRNQTCVLKGASGDSADFDSQILVNHNTRLQNKEKSTNPPDDSPEIGGRASDKTTRIANEPGNGRTVSKRYFKRSAEKTDTKSRYFFQKFINYYISGVVLTSLASTWYFFEPPTQLEWVGIILFAAFAFFTEVSSLEIFVKETSVSTSVIPLVAGTLLFGAVGAIALGFAAASGAALKSRSPLNRFLFNFGNFTLGNILALSVIQVSGSSLDQWPLFIQLVLTTLSVGFVYLSTTLIITGVIMLHNNLSFRELWEERYRWLAPYYLAMGIVTYLLIFTYQLAGVMGILVILIPIIMVRFSQKQYIAHTKDLVNSLREKNKELTDYAFEVTLLNEEMLLTLANSIDLRDPFVMEHSRNVARYAELIAKEMQLSDEQIDAVWKAGLLHDIGKLAIPEAVLFKPSQLTAEEFELVKKHAEIGADLIQGCHSLHHLIPIVRHHHEQYNGQGYPDGLIGEEIPLEARIVGLADAVEAMASDRPYSKASSPLDIIDEISRKSGSQFDPLVCDAFCQIVLRDGDLIIKNSARAVKGRQKVPSVKPG